MVSSLVRWSRLLVMPALQCSFVVLRWQGQKLGRPHHPLLVWKFLKPLGPVQSQELPCLLKAWQTFRRRQSAWSPRSHLGIPLLQLNSLSPMLASKTMLSNGQQPIHRPTAIALQRESTRFQRHESPPELGSRSHAPRATAPIAKSSVALLQ